MEKRPLNPFPGDADLGERHARVRAHVAGTSYGPWGKADSGYDRIPGKF